MLPAAIVLVAAAAVNYLRPVPAVAATTSRPAQSVIPGAPSALPWPSAGAAAIGASGLGLISASGASTPEPAASTAKVMTAYVVLADKPLAPGEDGPTLTLGNEDVAIYEKDAAAGQSVVRVAAGERLTEFQALEALLVPSGNNIAETLALWDAGSIPAFVARMNQAAASLHLGGTSFADPAGVSIQTVTTPTDLLRLGMAAMKLDVFAQVVGLPQTILPVAGIQYNVNGALGRSGIIGIKTGSGLDSGANFLFASAATIDGSQVTLFGCVMGQPTLEAAFQEAEALIAAMQSSLHVRQIAIANQAVGSYDSAWGSRADLIATSSATLVEWPGMTLRQHIDAPSLSGDTVTPRGTPAGNLHIVLGDQRIDVGLMTSAPVDPPGFAWRLVRIGP